jgi:pimeloyl-ACP methyl ester carboxylesterase
MENFYNINGQDIHVEEVGPKHGPIAILIHGWSSSWFTWKPILPSLSKRYRCIAIDLPGFGKSPAPTERREGRQRPGCAERRAIAGKRLRSSSRVSGKKS